jgi:GntR family transcriptional regulator, transcriptional repressor for pyruvate dehydrogenase complex
MHMSALASEEDGTAPVPPKTPGRGAQLRQPRIADLIAERLRSRIVNGEIADGQLLPKQDELLEEFEVSRPSLREALRILETEGLITVRRGNMGGAVVHAPKPEAAAFMMGLVLQAGQVPLTDLAEALARLEPACAAACADRADRATTAVPVLRAAIDKAAENIDDPMAFTQIAHRFHDELVGQCGNETLRLTVGTLVTLWSTQESAWAEGAEARHAFPDRQLRMAALRAHRKLVDAIERGDANEAARISYAHMEASQIHVLGEQGSASISVTQRGDSRSVIPSVRL